MTIKEVEQVLEIPRATVRFYENEELIKPSRRGNSYREYSEEDVATLKKIIILRKIGMSVSDVKDFLNENVTLQELLEKNIAQLQEQMKNLEGAIAVCKTMQAKNEDITTFDEEYYWQEIRTEEKAGNKFLEIVNDVVQFEKKVFLEEFSIADNEGKLLYGYGEATCRVLGTCFVVGILCFFLSGKEKGAFAEGFFWPFICIIIYSIFGLPLHFLGKKYPKAAERIKKMGVNACIVISVLLVLLVIWVKVNE